MPKNKSVLLSLISAQAILAGKMGGERNILVVKDFLGEINPTVDSGKLGNEPLNEPNLCILILSFHGVIHEYLTYGRKELTLAF